MQGWTETYRGVVSAWECDIVEHFTIAYYFARFADASRTFAELVGEAPALAETLQARPARLVTSFQAELRAGAAFHMLTAIIGLDEGTLRLGHQVLNSATGQPVTWVVEELDGRAAGNDARTRLAAFVTPWPGPKMPPADQDTPIGPAVLTNRDRVKPWEADERGCLSLSDHVHRFSAAGMQFLTSMGMTGTYMHEHRRGFSTFLLDTKRVGEARVGERVDVTTALAHVGNTSLRYVHRMTGADGRLIAQMVQAGVHLDLDARRPAPIPEVIRQRIAAEAKRD